MYFYAGRYDLALDSYQQAISSDQLDWWSPEKAQQLRFQIWAHNNPTPEPTPTDLPVDPNEYYILAAYSRFRIMLLNLVQGDVIEAEAVYNQLQQLFPPGQPGSAYAELAESFWIAYQNTYELSLACSQAVAYARANPQTILEPIGGFAHGFQSFFYKAEDICPIKE